MTRKEMIESIAKQAQCSKRLVRKKLFELSARFRRKYKDILFNQVFLEKSTDWKDFYELYDEWKKKNKEGGSPWCIPNQFQVIYFPSGCNVIFRVNQIYDGEIWEAMGECGTRLYNY